MDCLYLTVVINLLIYSAAELQNGWCKRYSRRATSLAEDISVVEASYTRFPNCEWQVHFENVTKLWFRLEISQMPFSSRIEFRDFIGQITTTRYDTLQVLKGSCNSGEVITSISGRNYTIQSINTDTLCFRHISNSENYEENRLQLRVNVTLLEPLCREDQHLIARCTTNKTWTEGTTAKSTQGNVPPTSTDLNIIPIFTKETPGMNTPMESSITTVDNYKIFNVLFQATNSFKTTSKNIFFEKATTTTPERTPKIGVQSTPLTNEQMTNNDIYTGLYISSTIAGIFTVVTLVLLICCVKKTREVNKLTKFQLSRAKQIQHNKIHRLDISGGWSSTSSTLRPALPPRPIDPPTVSDTTTETELSVYIHSKEEVYDNIGNIHKHKWIQHTDEHEQDVDHNKEHQGDTTHPESTKDHNNDEGFSSQGMQEDKTSISSGYTTGVYIDNNSIKSNTYRQVKKFRH